MERLQGIQIQGSIALRILEERQGTPETEAEVRKIAVWLREELRNEFARTFPERAQRNMSIFEVSVYAPTIEEAWKKSGISRLNLDDRPTRRWHEVLEGVVYTVGKYLE